MQFIPVTLLASSQKFTQYFPLLVTKYSLKKSPCITHLPKVSVTTAVNNYILLQVCHTGYLNPPALPQIAHAPETSKIDRVPDRPPQKWHSSEPATPQKPEDRTLVCSGVTNPDSAPSRERQIPDPSHSRRRPVQDPATPPDSGTQGN